MAGWDRSDSSGSNQDRGVSGALEFAARRVFRPRGTGFVGNFKTYPYTTTARPNHALLNRARSDGWL